MSYFKRLVAKMLDMVDAFIASKFIDPDDGDFDYHIHKYDSPDKKEEVRHFYESLGPVTLDPEQEKKFEEMIKQADEDIDVYYKRKDPLGD